ncbi:MAG TPA: DapH/DapD/GlmU-related protein [Chitinophagaceae bacterium]|nr:DapH/DapD/GlmU-related protein [Chitinophagaceae bacterium]
MSKDSSFIHPTSIIDEGAQIGAGTKIWHFCHLMPGAKVGMNCIIGQNVFVDNNVVLGNGVKVQNNVSIYNGVTVADDVFIGPSVVFTNVINPRSFIERKNEFKPTQIRKGASLGANCTILCGIEIGEYAMIGAGAVVINSIPAYASVAGNPAKSIGWISQSGMKLEFDNKERAKCSTTGQEYQLKNGLVSLLD